jgi:phosphoadenosine phosphosulfate reductase
VNIEKEKRAIEYLKSFEPETEPYRLCYSGGKDSDCIRILASLAGVKHDIVNNHTTVDAPETVRYIRSIPNIQIEYPKKTMWQLIEEKGMPPTRLVRYCCSELKEKGGKGRVKVTGVRWAESRMRAESAGVVRVIGKPKTVERIVEEMGIDGRKTDLGGYVLNDDNDNSRRFVEMCYRTTTIMVNPIVDWSDEDVWKFLKHYGCKSNPLYECGYKRIGCIGCPMASSCSRKREFAMYPKYKENYIRAFDRMLKRRAEKGLPIPPMWYDGEAVFKWWLGDDPYQLEIDF